MAKGTVIVKIASLGSIDKVVVGVSVRPVTHNLESANDLANAEEADSLGSNNANGKRDGILFTNPMTLPVLPPMLFNVLPSPLAALLRAGPALPVTLLKPEAALEADSCAPSFTFVAPDAAALAASDVLCGARSEVLGQRELPLFLLRRWLGDIHRLYRSRIFCHKMMDPLRILSRGSKPSKVKQFQHQITPSSGQNEQPQLFSTETSISKKRKRDGSILTTGQQLDFFGTSNASERPSQSLAVRSPDLEAQEIGAGIDSKELLEDDVKRILREHKLKFTYLNPPTDPSRERRKKKLSKDPLKNAQAKQQFYPEPLRSFDVLNARFKVGSRLAANVIEQGFKTPTEVQLGALPLLLSDPQTYLGKECEYKSSKGVDLLAVAPTGSGKTLAFLIPLIHQIQQTKHASTESKEKHTSAIILAPTKELVGQILNEGRRLCQGTGVRITQFRKGMQLRSHDVAEDSDEDQDKQERSVVKADIVVSTPGGLQGALGHEQGGRALSDIEHLVLDEADVLLDPLFREQTLAIWTSIANAKLRVNLWSATMGSNIEELAQSTIASRANAMKTDWTPLVRLVVGLKDSAIPNIDHRLIYAATEQGKLMGLRQLIRPTTSRSEQGPPLRPPFLIFTQTIERAIALHSELLYDIPAAAGGIARIAVLHSDLSDNDRDSIMTRFRRGEVWVLITTDLLSRGVDFRGINGVVNYDIPTSAAAYVHRVGRTGRAGREGGVAVTLYSKEDIPYLKQIANIVASSQNHKRHGGESIQQWLLDALPNLSKEEKRRLKKRGVESRTSKGKQTNPHAARKARISTKAGYVRKRENNRRGAIEGSRRRMEQEIDDAGNETDFTGFD
ncbi:P-loop containing nucleoside triphosphate hydrolase protein [Polychaeton citri CBS 116435]|uniref:ATP-dependent RNA helicase n=1 Tax=Polychaeton citri CBS 116435 TaxID=1314669 RepID=A0A9P4UHS8_9PEZI|nr:P-loop containing nucleoside triphosphate hydrolase protein [Polychaeton citri CBS 116435]